MTWKLAALLPCVSLLIAAVPDRNPATDPPPIRQCDNCDDLCYLVDQYLQKEKGIELWKRYAVSNPNRIAPPAGVTDTRGIENSVKKEFDDWARNRQQNRELPCKLLSEAEGWKAAKGSGAREATKSIGDAAKKGAVTGPAGEEEGGADTDLETHTQEPGCDIKTAGGEKLEGLTLQKFEQAQICKAISDAVIAHENVHKLHCMKAWSENHNTAAQDLDIPENVAESELQAWTKHKELLGEAIRALANRCGWQPTKRQLRDMGSVPSAAQTRKMEELGWKSFKALQSTQAGR